MSYVRLPAPYGAVCHFHVQQVRSVGVTVDGPVTEGYHRGRAEGDERCPASIFVDARVNVRFIPRGGTSLLKIEFEPLETRRQSMDDVQFAVVYEWNPVFTPAVAEGITKDHSREHMMCALQI